MDSNDKNTEIIMKLITEDLNEIKERSIRVYKRNIIEETGMNKKILIIILVVILLLLLLLVACGCYFRKYLNKRFHLYKHEPSSTISSNIDNFVSLVTEGGGGSSKTISTLSKASKSMTENNEGKPSSKIQK